MVELGLAGDCLNGIVNCANFGSVIVSHGILPARVEHDGFVVVEPATLGQI